MPLLVRKQTEVTVMTPDQLRMARALLRMTMVQLAEASGTDKMSILRMESGKRMQAPTVAKIKQALEARGVIFVAALVPILQPTVALRYDAAAPETGDEGDEEEDDDAPEMPIEGMRAYWSDEGRWSRLSPSGQKAIAKALDLPGVTGE